MPIAPRQRPNIDIAGSIGGLGDALVGGLEYGQKRKSDKATRAAFSEPVYNADGTMNFGAMAGKIMQGGGDIDTAMALTRLAETQVQNQYLRGKPNWQRLGPDLVDTNSPAFTGGYQQGGQEPANAGGLGEQPSDLGGQPVAEEQQAQTTQQPGIIRGRKERRTGTIGNKLVDLETGKVIQEYPAQPKALGATDRKAIRTAKEQNVQLKSTVASLDRALELNDKIFTGAGAEARQALGTQLPDWMVPNQVASPQQAQQTEEWRSLMKPEAIAAMANSLSGATTDFELRQFVELMADPKTTAQTRRGLIDRMKKLAVEKQALNEDLVREYEEGADVIAEPAAPAEVSPDNPVSPEQEGEIVESGGVRYMLMPDGTVVQLD